MSTRRSPREDLVPSACTLDGFTEALERMGGFDPSSLDPLSEMVVTTESTTYRITLIDPVTSRILVQDGKFFPIAFEAQLCGSSFGGSLLKQHWIGIGMRMELHCEQGHIVTTPVVSVELVEETAIAGPF